jgi:hypothetical protein
MQKIVTVHKTYARSLHQISANTKENWFTHIHHVFGSKAWMHTDIYMRTQPTIYRAWTTGHSWFKEKIVTIQRKKKWKFEFQNMRI